MKPSRAMHERGETVGKRKTLESEIKGRIEVDVLSVSAWPAREGDPIPLPHHSILTVGGVRPGARRGRGGCGQHGVHRIQVVSEILGRCVFVGHPSKRDIPRGCPNAPRLTGQTVNYKLAPVLPRRRQGLRTTGGGNGRQAAQAADVLRGLLPPRPIVSIAHVVRWPISAEGRRTLDRCSTKPLPCSTTERLCSPWSPYVQSGSDRRYASRVSTALADAALPPHPTPPTAARSPKVHLTTSTPSPPESTDPRRPAMPLG